MSENKNRAFMYGESVFTTMRMVESQLLDWDLHFDRLKRGIDYLYGPFSQGDGFAEELRDRLEIVWQRENGDKILRLTVFREQENRGVVRSGHGSVSDLRIQLTATQWEPSTLLAAPLSLRTCASPMRPSWWPPFLKCGNYLEVILAQKLFLTPEDDDLLFLGSSDTVTESSVANIFVVRKNKLFTAPCGSQVLEGVMRKKVINLSEEYFTSFVEEASTLDQLFRADAVFVTNSVRGIGLVGKVDGKDLNIALELKDKLLQLQKRLLS